MNLKKAEPEEQLIGHAKRNIEDGEYITIIWDSTTRIWTSPDIEFTNPKQGPFR